MQGGKVRGAHSIVKEACDYTAAKRRAGVELVFECGSCVAGRELDDPACFRNVLRAVQREGAPIAIALRSHMEKRYGSYAAGTMAKIADILSRVENLQRQLATDSLKREGCAECLRPLAERLSAVRQCILSMDLDRAISSGRALGGLTFGSGREACVECRGITIVQASDIARSAEDLEKIIVGDMFNIGEG